MPCGSSAMPRESSRLLEDPLLCFKDSSTAPMNLEGFCAIPQACFRIPSGFRSISCNCRSIPR
eukprot:7874711-Pyramimonas_sp.AAC.1